MRIKKMKKLLCLVLVLGLLFSTGITTAYTGNSTTLSGSLPSSSYHYTLDEIVELFGDTIDDEEMLKYAAFVYKGWRTSYGNWLNAVMEDIKSRLEEVGYRDVERTTDGNQGDCVWFQNQGTFGNAWNPQYVSLQIVDDPGGYSGTLTQEEGALTSEEREALAEKINVLADCIDPTSMYYPEHINDDGTWLYEALKKGEGDPDYIKMQQVNKRVHLPTNAPFTAITDPDKTPEENIEAGTKIGEVVYVGTVTSNSNSEGIPAEELAGKILLTTTTGNTARNYANNVGALAVLARVSDAPDYHMPVIDGERWYTDYVPYRSMGSYAAPGVAVPFHFSLDQFEAMLQLLADGPVYMSVCALGTYEQKPQRMLVAEIQGAVKPEERIYVPAHINEPGAHDNASGVAMGYVIAKTMLEMINSGELARPERTITFVWGDEITMTNWWEAKYRSEFLNVKGSIDLDMTGGDPEKTGSSMLIEKTPDPANVARNVVDEDLRYRYGNFTFPGQEDLPLQYDTFVRKPDKFSLWTGGTDYVTTPVHNYPGFYLNDLYLQTGLMVQEKFNPDFKVDFNPYEGGSDHSPFVVNALSRVGTFIPALLTWHFTDYVYHSSCDTLDKLSVTEFHDVGTVSAAVVYQMANGWKTEAADTIFQVLKSWEARMEYEKQNTEDHYQWMLENPAHPHAARSYERELKAIGDWSRWYIEAVKSAGKLMVGRTIGTPYVLSPELQAIEDAAVEKIQAETLAALDYVDEVFGGDSAERPKQIASAKVEVPVFVPASKYASASELAAAELPTKITVEYVGGGTGEADVTWSATTSPSYNPGRNGLYRFTGTLSGLEDGVVNWAVVEAVAEVNCYSDAVKPGVYLENTEITGRVSNSVTLKAVAESYDGGELSYQWYRNSTRSVLCGELIEGATDSEYTFTLPNTPGTAYYYCVVTNTNEAAAGEKTASRASEVATVTAKRAPRDSGSGSDTGATPAAPESPATPPVLSFSDVSEGDWFYGAVQFAHENGLMMGTSDGKFSPHATTTRGMVVTILYRLFGSPAIAGTKPFADVEAGQYYYDAVIWASNNNLISGYPNGDFGPNEPITREQLAVILMNYAKFKGYDVSWRADLSKFRDAGSVSQWARDALAWANALGLIQGVGGDMLNPGGDAERCQVAAILQRFIEKYAD